MTASTSTTTSTTTFTRHGASPWRRDLATVGVLWRRDVVRFFRERTRVVGALLQPLIFWLVIGSGLSPTFRMPGAEGVSYLQYFFPGVLLMVVLFTSIFATMSVIEDRHQGFLQAVLVAPGSRSAVVVGKTLGATTVAMVQAGLFAALAPLAGFAGGQVEWGWLVLALVTTSVALSAFGFAVAWWLDSTQGYHVVMSVLLLPLWIISGAMFPAPEVPWLQVLLQANPMSWAVGAMRHALQGGPAPDGMLVGFALVALGLAIVAIHRRR